MTYITNNSTSLFINCRSGLIICLLCSFNMLVGQEITDWSALQAKADLILEESVNCQDFVGISAGIFADDKVVWANGAGLLDRENNIPADRNMLHRIASITKPMTAVAILQLEAAGKLELDVPVQTYLPEFPNKRKGEITIRQLLTHTAGVGAYRNSAETYSDVEYENLAEAMTIFQGRRLRSRPGTKFQYTTYGYVILGAIIEAVTGGSYADYMQENIWTPAGMNTTGIEQWGAAYDNKSKLYGHTNVGTIIEDQYDNLSIKYPGGGLHSTAEDLLRFGQAILDNQLISAEQLELMQQAPDVERDDTPYGMGWFVYTSEKYGRAIRHGGSQSGTSTYLTIYLDQRVVVAMISNTAGASIEIDGMRGRLNLLALEPATATEPMLQLATLNEAQLDRFVGEYEYEGGTSIRIKRQGQQLWMEKKDWPDLKLYPYAEDGLFLRLFDAQLDFETSGSEEFTGLTESAQGATNTARKVK